MNCIQKVSLMNCIEKVSEEYIAEVSLNSIPKLTAAPPVPNAGSTRGHTDG
jgi:hypothetical protein